jgi:hypothetical protein
MAVIKATITDMSSKGDGSAQRVVWAAVTESDTFAAAAMPEYTARSVHVSGTFGGATVVLNGSNTGTNYFGLNNMAGTAISVATEALKQVLEGVINYQPAASGGTSQSLTVTMLFVGPRRY